MVMGDDRDPVGNLSFPNTVDIRLHQGAADLLALVLFQYGQRVNGDGTATLLVTNSLSILKSPTLAFPLGRKFHGAVGDTGRRGTGGNDVADQCRRRLGVTSLDDGESEHSQAKFGTTAQTIDELLSRNQVSHGALLQIIDHLPLGLMESSSDSTELSEKRLTSEEYLLCHASSARSRGTPAQPRRSLRH